METEIREEILLERLEPGGAWRVVERFEPWEVRKAVAAARQRVVTCQSPYRLRERTTTTRLGVVFEPQAPRADIGISASPGLAGSVRELYE